MGHTPGPWKVSHDDHEPYWNIDMPMQDGSGRYGFANSMVYTTEADAHLMAAAPELLAACCGMVDAFDRGDAADEQVALRTLRAAIAKAEGRA